MEKDMKTRQQRLLTCIIITPGTLMSLMTNYLLRAFDINNAFYYNIAIIILQFAAFIYFSINKGALGIKVTLERNSMDRTMRALTSGTAILNHTIKNQVLKISICMNNIEHAISRINTDKERDVQDNINIVIDATDYLVDMINKIQDHVKDIKIEESELVLGNVIEKAVNMISLFANEKNIIVSRIFSGDYLLKGDVLHLQESFINILKNSIESINSGGLIELDIIRKKKWLSVIIRDNGAGIPKENIPHVIDPFFSTKKRTGNFGLGLSYCYSVMQHHNGSLDIESKEGVGTTVTLNFPTKRLIG
jgi:signal transduction histidine kinase